MSDKIKSVCVVTQCGASCHYIGANSVHSIQQEDMHIQGDPFMHYVGRDEKGRIVFKISGLAPVEVIYETATITNNQ